MANTRSRGKRSFGGLRQLPSGRWQANYTGPDGRLYKAPATFGAKVDAEAWLTDRRREIDRDLWSPPVDAVTQETRRRTFGEYAENWLTRREVGGRPIKPRTKAHYRRILDAHLLPRFGSLPLASITSAEIRDWYAELLPNRPTMRAHTYSLLRTIMATAADEDLIAANPVKVRGAGAVKRTHKPKPATLGELDVIAENMPERWRLMVPLSAWCALRFGETVELRVKDLELPDARDEPGLIRVRRAAVRAAVRAEGGTFVVSTPKSDAGVRDVAIPPHLLPEIREHLARLDPGPEVLLFPADHGGHLQPSTLYRHFYRARQVAGREDLRWHDLRHTGAVLAAGTGATLAELMDRLGHSTPQAAMRYQHSAQGRDRAIASALSKLIEG
ncbi:site-specific integrase [Gordonia sp. CPCC 206044]|uniref:tyrosine-type recombinase/integrase n=1 Tax=Gordonia sp. CPCC 206044 TaxID=3140793 RepID=UPI003AF36B48